MMFPRSLHSSGSTASEALLSPLREACRLEALRGGPIVVGVSGGADSVGLLHAIVRGGVLPEARLHAERPILVAHVQHDLREEAALDREFVEALARQMGLGCVTRRIACRDEARKTGEGIEASARRLRYEFFGETAKAAGARAVIVAHTADDQAETILHAILRGTGLAGLAGMSPARELVEGIALIRPLLEIDRSVVRGYLVAVGQAWMEDASNSDTRFARNHIRRVVLPTVSEGPYPAAARSIRRLGLQAAGVAQAVASAAELLLEEHSRREKDGSIALDPRRLARLDHHMLGEIFVAVWRREAWPRRDMTARHYRQLAAMLSQAAEAGCAAAPSAVDLPGGVRAEVQRSGCLRLSRDSGKR